MSIRLVNLALLRRSLLKYRRDMTVTWPLVGRGEELSHIAAALHRKEAAGLMITGPAGVGKTRLMTEALAQAPSAKFCVHRATATRAAATMPLGAVSHLLPDSDEQVSLQPDLLRRSARSLIAQGGARRVVVAVDDAHLLDEASAALVHHLATASPVFVLATVRDGEPAPDAVRFLCKDHATEQLTIGPLPDDEVGEAVRATLNGPVSGSVVHRLTALSGGNPLLLTELVDTALGEGRLIHSGGLWRLPGAWVSPQTLPELVRERLTRLPPEVYAAAELLALGGPLGAAEVEAMLRPEVAAAAEREGLFTATPSGRRQQLRLVHPLYAEALRAAITPLRARAAYRQLADTLAATGARRRGDALRLAVWRLDGGQAADPELLLRAAREDGALFDRDTAERLARAAEDAGGGLPARLVRVEALRWLGRAEEAGALLADVDTGCAGAEQRCRVAAVRASNLYFGLNRPADAERVIAEARERICSRAVCGDGGSVQALCSELDALQAEFWFNAGRVDDATGLAADVLSRPNVGARAQANAAAVASISRTWSGQTEQAVAVAEQALTRCPQSDEELTFAVEDLLLFTRCIAHLYAGRLGLAQQLATGGYQQALNRHAEALQGRWALALGDVARLGGRVDTARRWLREAAVLIEQHAPTMGRYGVAYALGYLAEAAALGGDLAEVDAALARADSLLPAGVVLCNRERGPVWAAAARGEISTARRRAMDSADALASAGAHLHEAMACHDVVRLGAPDRVDARTGRLAAKAEGDLVPLYARHADALVAADAPALAEVATEFSTLGAQLLAAEAAAEAADAYRRAGRKASALAAAERSRELASQCEGARTPALALAGEPLPLTPREREIATLAASGLSDRDIAAQLVVSERTVHNHLHRTYTKLGINTRRQLRSILH